MTDSLYHSVTSFLFHRVLHTVQSEAAVFVQNSSLSVVSLIVRITSKVIDEWFCRVPYILVRLYSPKQELKDKHWRADRREYTHPHSLTLSLEGLRFYMPWVERS
jgi:hypothetical protein